MKLSIVIPVYNVEKYIEKCLNSCVNQDLSKDDYEIIVVNDGSPDNSLSIVNEIAKAHSNIIIIDQKNQGLSGARNNGLKQAKGDYVWFVDSDDWIENNCLGKVAKKIEGHDVLAIDYIYAYDNATRNRTVCYKMTGALPGKDFLLQGYRVPAQMYVFRRLFLIENELHFYLGAYHEDTEFTPRALYLAKSVCYLNAPVYYFYKRPNSITTMPNPKRAFDCIIVSTSLNTFVERVDKKYRHCFYNRIGNNVSRALSIISQADKQRQREFYVFLMENKKVLRAMRKSTRAKLRIIGLCLCLMPCITYKICISLKVKESGE